MRPAQTARVAHWFLLGLTLAMGSSRADAPIAVPVAVPERPFLLVDAPRRFTPRETALIHIQKRDGGTARVSVFRVLDSMSLIAAGTPSRQGFAIASTPYGPEAESLVEHPGSLPRRLNLLEFVSDRRVELHTRAPLRNVRRHESDAYDSNENSEGDVETYGVHADGWIDENVALGQLTAGFYIVRVHVGAWATAAILSVGELTLIARRGDDHDTVFVTDANGAPQRNVNVHRFDGSRMIATGRTSANGEVWFPADNSMNLRFVAERGPDFAWADVTHARLEPCDVRVYLATGRPVFRNNELIHVRGHVRGCDAHGPVPLSNELVRVFPTRDEGARGTSVRTDVDGNFTAILVASGQDINAEVRGRIHSRSIQIDSRSLPRRILHVLLDRSSAMTGDTVSVRVADDDGGWPTRQTVSIDLPTGQQYASIGPGQPASVSFVVPAIAEPISRATVRASLAADGVTTFADADLWLGHRSHVVEIAGQQLFGTRDGLFDVSVRANDLAGNPAEMRVFLAVRASDGNRATGSAQWTGRVDLDATGTARASVHLVGPGPWSIEARGAESEETPWADLVVWDRPRPSGLSARGDLAVQTLVREIRSGQQLDVQVRTPGDGGATWLTLEQGSVWASALVSPAALETTHLQVAPEARGLASVVATHIHEGQVTTASAVTEVESSRALRLSVETNKRVYANAESAHVVIQSHTEDGAPRDGVVSLWLADAGYWELGTEDYPIPTDYFRLPGRRASAGDSSRPIGYGAEEGRRLDTQLNWNGAPLSHATFRHAWGFGGELVSFHSQGTLETVFSQLAREAGFSRASVCAEISRALGPVSLDVRNLPWDLVAMRVADETETFVRVRGNVLDFACDAPSDIGIASDGVGGGGCGMGSGAGSAIAGREQNLEGTLVFIGTRRIGPTGRLDLDLAMPDHPGRWRIETLAIADDGGGNRAHSIATTVQTVEARVEMAPWVRVGDAASGEVSIHAPTLAGHDAVLSLEVSPAGATIDPSPRTLRVGADGWARTRFALRPTNRGDIDLIVTARIDSQTDRVRRVVHVSEDLTSEPLVMRNVVGPEATDVVIPLPELTRPSTVRIRVGSGIADGIDEALVSLQTNRWQIASLQVDRLAALRALQIASATLSVADRDRREYVINRAISSQIEAIRELIGPDGAVAWWSRMHSSPLITGELLYALGDSAVSSIWSGARDFLRRESLHGGSPELLAIAASVLAHSRADGDVRIAQTLVRQIQSEHLSISAATSLVRAASDLHDRASTQSGLVALRQAVEEVITLSQPHSCAGPDWFLCLARFGTRATVARAASALLIADPVGGRALAGRVVHWLATNPGEPRSYQWGSDEPDILELTARLEISHASDTRYEVWSGSHRLARGDASAPSVVVVARGPLRISFGTVANRTVRVSIDGELSVAPLASPAGTISFVRRFNQNINDHSLVLEFATQRADSNIEMVVPLPGGLDVGTRSGDAHGTRTTAALDWRWFDVDLPEGQLHPHVERVDGTLRIRLNHVRAGRHSLRIPMLGIASGTYQASAAWLRTDRPEEWAIATPVIVPIP